MCSGGLVSKPQGEPGTKSAHNVLLAIPVSLVRIELMSCVLAELVSKPQGEPGSKPAHTVHFLHSWVIG